MTSFTRFFLAAIRHSRMCRRGAAWAGVAALSACTALPEGARVEVDQQKVGQIERTARDRGVQVMWFNYPTRVVDSTPATQADTRQPGGSAPGK